MLPFISINKTHTKNSKIKNKKSHPKKNSKRNPSPQFRVSYLCQWVRQKKYVTETAGGWVGCCCSGGRSSVALTSPISCFADESGWWIFELRQWVGCCCASGWGVFKLHRWVSGLSVPVHWWGENRAMSKELVYSIRPYACHLFLGLWNALFSLTPKRCVLSSVSAVDKWAVQKIWRGPYKNSAF